MGKNILTILIFYVLIMVTCNAKPQSINYLPTLKINNSTNHNIAKAYRIAIGDITGNIQKHQSGILSEAEPCILAGLFYDKPWTRDAAINVWNGGGLLFSEAAKNTLLAQIAKNDAGNNEIIGQYWDKIIWGIGAWNYYLYNQDKEFLEFSYNIIKNTLIILEIDEFDKNKNLFRGPAVYGDGVAAYPQIYTESEIEGHSATYSGIYQWTKENPSRSAKIGYGMPMMALSTNCVYAEVYQLLSLMEIELNISNNDVWQTKATSMKKAINSNFWNQEKGRYNYLIDSFGGSDYQEGMGLAFSILFRIADKKQTQQIFQNISVVEAGIPCVYPSFPRFKKTPDSYGRHSGTVWPHVQGFWADACMKNGNIEGFLHEFNNLTKHAVRDNQFVEIYHPSTGMPYGGLQEPHLEEVQEWFCAERQTWSATAYLRMIMFNIIGMEFTTDGIKFNPYLSKEIDTLEFGDLVYQNSKINIKISGIGGNVKSFKINGKNTQPFLKNSSKGDIDIEIIMGK